MELAPVNHFLDGLSARVGGPAVLVTSTDGGATCQTYLCPRACKNDAARKGVLPAITEHGAQLLTECRVVRLGADRARVREVICEHRSGPLTLKAKVVVLRKKRQ